MSRKKWWKKLFKIFCTNVWSQVKSNVIVRRRNIFSYVWNWVKQLVFWTKCVFSCVSGESETSEIYFVMWEKNNNWWLIEQLKFFHVQNEFFISLWETSHVKLWKNIFYRSRKYLFTCETQWSNFISCVPQISGEKKKTSCVKLSENSKIQVNTFLHVWNWVKIMGSFAGEEKLTCETNFFSSFFRSKGKKSCVNLRKKLLGKRFCISVWEKRVKKMRRKKNNKSDCFFFHGKNLFSKYET